MAKNPNTRPKFRNFAGLAIFVLTLGLALPLFAQAQTSDQKPQTQSQPEAGGPQGDLGPIIVPKIGRASCRERV